MLRIFMLSEGFMSAPSSLIHEDDPKIHAHLTRCICNDNLTKWAECLYIYFVSGLRAFTSVSLEEHKSCSRSNTVWCPQYMPNEVIRDNTHCELIRWRLFLFTNVENLLWNQWIELIHSGGDMEGWNHQKLWPSQEDVILFPFSFLSVQTNV